MKKLKNILRGDMMWKITSGGSRTALTEPGNGTLGIAVDYWKPTFGSRYGWGNFTDQFNDLMNFFMWPPLA